METVLWFSSSIMRGTLGIIRRFAGVALVMCVLLALVILCDENGETFPFQPRDKI